MNYFNFIGENVNLSQGYMDGNHYNHAAGSPCDYAIDWCGKDGGKDVVYCRCDEMVVTKKWKDNAGANIIHLQSTSKVNTSIGDYIVWAVLVHPDDEDITNIYVGKKYSRNEIITKEGSTGIAYGKHIHLVVGIGNAPTGMVQNNLGSWVFNGISKKPEELIYFNSSINKIIDVKGINFIYEPVLIVPVLRDERVNQIEVIVDNLRLRDKSGLSSNILGVIPKGVYNYISTLNQDDYVWYEIEKDKWIASNTGWTNIYPKKEVEDQTMIIELQKKIDELNLIIHQQGKEIIDLKESKDKDLLTFLVNKNDKYTIQLCDGEILKYKIIKT